MSVRLIHVKELCEIYDTIRFFSHRLHFNEEEWIKTLIMVHHANHAAFCQRHDPELWDSVGAGQFCAELEQKFWIKRPIPPLCAEDPRDALIHLRTALQSLIQNTSAFNGWQFLPAEEVETLRKAMDQIAESLIHNRDLAPPEKRSLPVVEIDLYTEPPLRDYVRRKTVQEVHQEIIPILKNAIGEDLYTIETEGLDMCDVYASEPFPTYRFLACHATTVGSEGYWVHVEAIAFDKEKKVRVANLVFTLKTFKSLDFAWEIAKTIALILEA